MLRRTYFHNEFSYRNMLVRLRKKNVYTARVKIHKKGGNILFWKIAFGRIKKLCYIINVSKKISKNNLYNRLRKIMLRIFVITCYNLSQ